MIKINLPEAPVANSKPSYCLTVFQNKLFLARAITNLSGSQDYLSIFCFLPKLGIWQKIHDTLLSQDDQDSLPEKGKIFSNELETHKQYSSEVYIQAAILPGPANTSECLYVYIRTPKAEHLIHTENGELFHLDTPIQNQATKVFSSQKFLIANNIFYTLFSPFTTQTVKGDHQQNLETYALDKYSQWRLIFSDGLETIGNQEISSFSLFEDCLHIATTNLHKGFQVWKATPSDISGKNLDWQAVIADGAYRYVLNQQISKMLPFQGSLYLTSGLKIEQGKEQEHAFYPGGFEIIRIYPDNDWDIIVGTPRFTKDGLKVPLSTKGPGFDDPYLTSVECLTIHNEHLYLATQNLDALQIWRSEYGEDWTVLSLNQEISRYRNLESLNVLSTDWGLILAINSYNADESKQLEIWSLDE